MNRQPQLRNFIKNGGAISFQNVEINWVKGKRSILTIFHDGIEQEQIELNNIPSEKEMQQLMFNKGFVLKSQEERNEIMKKVAADRQREIDKWNRNAKDREERMMKILDQQENKIGDLMKQIGELRDNGGDPDLIKELGRKLFFEKRSYEKERQIYPKRLSKRTMNSLTI